MNQFIPYIINPTNHCVSHFTTKETNEVLILDDENTVQEFLKDKVKKIVEFKSGGEKALCCLYNVDTKLSDIPDGFYGLVDSDNGVITLYNKSTGYLSTQNDIVVLYKYEKTEINNVVNNLATSIILNEKRYIKGGTGKNDNENENEKNYNKLVDDLKNFDFNKLKKVTVDNN